MKLRTHRLAAVTVLAILPACQTVSHGPSTDEPGDVADLTAYMTGWFDSSAQAEAAPDDYFNIRLVMIPVWPARTDGRWLYVEQAAASALEHPYRQRVYHVHSTDDGRIASDVYTLPGDPLDQAGAWADGTLLDGITPDDLTLRDGCTLVLDRMSNGTFAGATRGNGCSSSLGDAAYATSEVSIGADLLVSWDRGWTASGEQAWGATAGGYKFVRRGRRTPIAGAR